METPESIRQQYASPPRGESAEQRRRRLANRRAAKYRHFRALQTAQDSLGTAAQQQRAQNTRRQRSRRERLDDDSKQRVREQNRRRQQARRQALSEPAREEIREKQRHRQRKRRQLLDAEARDELRERERLRIRRRRHKQREKQQQQDEHTAGQTDDQGGACSRLQRPSGEVAELGHAVLRPSATQRSMDMTPPTLPHLRVPNASVSASTPELPTLRQHQEQQRRQSRHVPFGGSDGQFTLPMPLPTPPPPVSALERPHTAFRDRMPALPHLQQVTRPQSTGLLHAVPPPLFPMPTSSVTATGAAIGSSTVTSASPALSSAVAGARSHTTHTQSATIMSSVSLAPANTPLGGVLPLVSHRPQQSQSQTQTQQPRAPIVLPPAHRSLPPLPDFLNSREAFDPASTASTASGSTSSAAARSGPRRALFPSISELSGSHSEPQEPEVFYRQ